MDPEPASRAEGGEAVAASGAAAAATFRESPPQVSGAAGRGGGAEAGARRTHLPLCLVCRLPSWPAWPSSEQAGRRRCVSGFLLTVAPPLPKDTGLGEGADASPPPGVPHQPLRWPHRRLWGFGRCCSSFGSWSERRRACPLKAVPKSNWKPGDGGFRHLQPLRV